MVFTKSVTDGPTHARTDGDGYIVPRSAILRTGGGHMDVYKEVGWYMQHQVSLVSVFCTIETCP